jgi:hypothetical protein
VPGRDRLVLPGLVGRQPGRGDELRGEQAAHPLLAAADEQPLRVVLLRPAHRQAELLECLVERGQVPVPLGVGEHAVAVEDQRVRHA